MRPAAGVEQVAPQRADVESPRCRRRADDEDGVLGGHRPGDVESMAGSRAGAPGREQGGAAETGTPVDEIRLPVGQCDDPNGCARALCGSRRSSAAAPGAGVPAAAAPEAAARQRLPLEASPTHSRRRTTPPRGAQRWKRSCACRRHEGATERTANERSGAASAESDDGEACPSRTPVGRLPPRLHRWRRRRC